MSEWLSQAAFYSLLATALFAALFTQAEFWVAAGLVVYGLASFYLGGTNALAWAERKSEEVR